MLVWGGWQKTDGPKYENVSPQISDACACTHRPHLAFSLTPPNCPGEFCWYRVQNCDRDGRTDCSGKLVRPQIQSVQQVQPARRIWSASERWQKSIQTLVGAATTNCQSRIWRWDQWWNLLNMNRQRGNGATEFGCHELIFEAIIICCLRWCCFDRVCIYLSIGWQGHMAWPPSWILWKHTPGRVVDGQLESPVGHWKCIAWWSEITQEGFSPKIKSLWVGKCKPVRNSQALLPQVCDQFWAICRNLFLVM